MHEMKVIFEQAPPQSGVQKGGAYIQELTTLR